MTSDFRSTPQTLLFDADDTLWENNVYFEQAIAAFISYLDHRVHSPAEVREYLNQCERVTIAAHGYGLESFRRSLIDCFEQLSQAPSTAQHHNQIVSFTEAIASSQIDLLPEVEATLQQLTSRHRCLLVTKGNLGEQTGKLERSGIQAMFTGVEVLPEKNERAYRELVERYGLDPAATWMIGNSPKSDINPALAAGLNAVFLPHASTWVLEHEAVDAAPAGRELLELKTFADLQQHF